jgi:hypothetical protein
MRRASAILGVAVALLASGLTLTSADASSRETLRFVSEIEQEAEIDVGKKGASLGDQLVFNESLRSRHSRDAGELNGVCTVTQLHRDTGVVQCQVTVSLDDGDLTVQGVVELEEDRATLAVTGGTGDYDDASGEVDVRFINDEKSFISFDLND